MAYRCIQCLTEAPSLYKMAADQYIKLTECVKCGGVVDRYVECEASVVMVDMLLLDDSAYRHALHNSDFATSAGGLLKALACVALSGGYYNWATVCPQSQPARCDSYRQETVFYLMCLLAASQLLIHILFIYFYCRCRNAMSLKDCSRCAVIGQFSTALHVPATVWQLSQWPLYCALAALYTALTATLALSGLTGRGRAEAGAVVAASALTSALVSSAVLALVCS
ncbi:protein ARV1 [Hyalella azteca]|uniref:Protein ARV n=1 Tax=Hyalella azteca TaxID=294128 RepID=A0A979FPT8_HYAAZ|nr:protein ARV1 [Hyalella azteca]